MKFIPGDLVTLSDLTGPLGANLRPTLNFFDLEENGAIVRQKEVAVVIKCDRADCRNVQIITKKGLGWIAGAFLKKID
jgi:hypothetical protein